MPRRPRADHASERTPREPRTAHLRLLLAGDLESPQQVMADRNLNAAKKREIFAVWMRDLEAGPHDAEARRLKQEIRDAVAMLDAEEKPAR